MGMFLQSKMMGIPILKAGDGTGVNKLLDNAKSALDAWGKVLMTITGIAMIIIGVFKIAQGLMSHGKSQVNWVVNILLIVIGTVFCIGSAWGKLTSNNSFGGLITSEIDGLARD